MDYSRLSGPADAEAAEPVVSAQEVCLEEKSITRLVEPPFSAFDIKALIVSGRLNTRTIEMTCTVFVCLLALCCCLFAKGQNDKLEAETTRLKNYYSSAVGLEIAERMRLERELSAVRQQLEFLRGRQARELDSAAPGLHYRLPLRPPTEPTPFVSAVVPPPTPPDSSLANINSISSSTSDSDISATETKVAKVRALKQHPAAQNDESAASPFDILRHEYSDKTVWK
jgi:hypothetical protein